MIRPTRLWPGARDLARGAYHFVRWSTSVDPRDVGLAEFAAPGLVTRRGVPATYRIRLASFGHAPRLMKLLIDVYALRPPPNQDGHHAYFSSRLALPPRAATTVEVTYDWQRLVRLSAGGGAVAADEVWLGAEGLPQVYVVYAVLQDPDGVERDRLLIAQRLAA